MHNGEKIQKDKLVDGFRGKGKRTWLKGKNKLKIFSLKNRRYSTADRDRKRKPGQECHAKACPLFISETDTKRLETLGSK